MKKILAKFCEVVRLFKSKILGLMKRWKISHTTTDTGKQFHVSYDADGDGVADVSVHIDTKVSTDKKEVDYDRSTD